MLMIKTLLMVMMMMMKMIDEDNKDSENDDNDELYFRWILITRNCMFFRAGNIVLLFVFLSTMETAANGADRAITKDDKEDGYGGHGGGCGYHNGDHYEENEILSSLFFIQYG